MRRDGCAPTPPCEIGMDAFLTISGQRTGDIATLLLAEFLILGQRGQRQMAVVLQRCFVPARPAARRFLPP